MQQELSDIREKQKSSWNQFSSGWKKWEPDLCRHMQPASDAIIDALQPAGTQIILDIAAGTGEPGLSIAKILTGGKVVITDLADEMLDIARENAAKKGIANVEFSACDVCELPFADNTFDSVSCRMGFMFFPDMHLAAKEIYRVLKPGGSIATSVWNKADKNFWAAAVSEIISRNMELPAPPPGAPGIFRCGEPGLIAGIFKAAGFKNITEKEVACNMQCESAAGYWQMMTEIAAPVVGALSKADDSMKEKIKNELIERINNKYPDGNILMEGSAQVISAVK